MKTQVRELLDRVQSTADFSYVPFHSINDVNALGDNALHCICVWGDIEAAKLLVESGIGLHQQGEFGFTPLRVVSDFGHSLIVEYLLAAGADPSALEAPEVFDGLAHAQHMTLLANELMRLQAR